jgi:hypothetical protein
VSLPHGCESKVSAGETVAGRPKQQSGLVLVLVLLARERSSCVLTRRLAVSRPTPGTGHKGGPKRKVRVSAVVDRRAAKLQPAGSSISAWLQLGGQSDHS